MTGKGRFLIGSLLAILVFTLALSWGFMGMEADRTNSLPDDGLPLDGMEYDDATGSVPDGGISNEVEPASGDIPWETGITVFVLLSASVMIVLFARIREEDVLEGLRKDIYEYISENPGEHLAEITRHFEISSSSARHHLDVLEWSDRIVSHYSGKQKHFYPNRNGYRKYTSGYGYKEIMATLKNDTSRRMVKYIMNNRNANQKAIAQALRIHPSTVNWHAKRLNEAQIIFKKREGKDIHYSLNPELDLVNVISLIEGASS